MPETNSVNGALLLIQLYKGAEESHGELRRSLVELQRGFDAMGVSNVMWRSDAGVTYFEWPGFLDLATLVSCTGGGVGIYKMLRLWLESRKGRRIRLKIDDVELEATQMTSKDFLRLLESALKMRNQERQKRRPEGLEGSSMARSASAPSGSTFIHALTIDEFLAWRKQENTAGAKNSGEHGA